MPKAKMRGNQKKTLKVVKDLIVMGLEIAEDEIIDRANVPYDIDEFFASEQARNKGITVDALMKDPRVQRKLRAYVKNMLEFSKGMERFGKDMR